MRRFVIAACCFAGTAHADPETVAIDSPAPSTTPAPPAANPMPVTTPPALPASPPLDHLHRQLQADLGLAVIGAAYEQPLAAHVAVQVEAQIFGTYFLPWFDAGADVQGLGAQVRPTWFLRDDGRGLYLAGYLRGVLVRGDKDGETGTGNGYCAGAFAGWAFGLTKQLDLRVGAGAQYIAFHVDTDAGRLETSTPFVALDAVIGYRLR
ncbi:MAG TPA: hypothetical protein VFQ53_03935 [Kofleriaceae bacterium]|nr:hypothetical protein [Kofleriaceae bacterium]